MGALLSAALAAWLASSDMPQTIAGPWETAAGANVDGIFLKTSLSTASGDLQDLEVRVYHRRSGKETHGWFVGRDGVDFDGRQLQIPRIGLDVVLEHDKWTGVWEIDGQTRGVVLERPHPSPEAIVSVLCGGWDGLPNRFGDSGLLTIAQSRDGALTAWMHTESAPSAPPPVRLWYGVRLQVAPRLPASVLLWDDEQAGMALYRYEGVLASDGYTLDGVWRGGDFDPDQMTLGAPRTFRRMHPCM